MVKKGCRLGQTDEDAIGNLRKGRTEAEGDKSTNIGTKGKGVGCLDDKALKNKKKNNKGRRKRGYSEKRQKQNKRLNLKGGRRFCTLLVNVFGLAGADPSKGACRLADGSRGKNGWADYRKVCRLKRGKIAGRGFFKKKKARSAKLLQ